MQPLLDNMRGRLLLRSLLGVKVNSLERVVEVTFLH